MQLKNKQLDLKRLFMIIFILMCVGVAVTSFWSGPNKNPELQPWYFLMAIPLAGLVAQKKLVVILTICISFAMLASYIPFLLTGEWPKDIVDLKINLLIYSIVIGSFLFIASSKGVYSSIRNILK